MKVIGTDGKTYTWKLADNRRESCSEGHELARMVLATIFPFDRRLEEVPLPCCRLTADFYIPTKRLMVEVQGVQHERFVPFFFKSLPGFWKANNRDSRKREFCERNDIRLVELAWKEIGGSAQNRADKEDEIVRQWTREILQ